MPATSGVVNWPVAGTIFLDIFGRDPGLWPPFQAPVALSSTDQAKTGPAIGPILPKNDLMSVQGLA